MTFRLKDQLGKAWWSFVRDDNPMISSFGTHDAWRDRNATLQMLVEAVPPMDRGAGEFRLTEYQKVGRRIQQVVIKTVRYEPHEVTT